MSFNVRFDTQVDGDNRWDMRKGAVPTMIADQKPTIWGVQECVHGQKQYMDENCAGYKSIGIGRDDGLLGGEFMAIYYAEDVVSLDDWGTFWLSETPDQVSKGWDADCFRTATWAKFTLAEGGKKFFMINTHLDHKGAVAQAESMRLIDSKIKELNGEELPVVVIADFNRQYDTPIFDPVRDYLLDAREHAAATDDMYTFNGWGRSAEHKVDIILTSKFTPLTFEVIDQTYDNVPYISDHYPVIATLEF